MYRSVYRSSYIVIVCDCVFLLYDFLHSRSLRLCISSVRFLSSYIYIHSGSLRLHVYFICTIYFFFFCQHFKDLYLHYVLTDFDNFFFQVSVHHPILCYWGERSRRGTGVKNVDFTKNATPPTDHVTYVCSRA